jgi:hypothetical protein
MTRFPYVTKVLAHLDLVGGSPLGGSGITIALTTIANAPAVPILAA